MSNSVNLVDEVSNVIKQRTNLAYLYASVAEGMIHANKGFVRQNSEYGTLVTGTEWIRLIRLNKVSFNKWVSWKRNYCRSDRDNNRQFLTMFNGNYKSYNNSDPQTMFYMGVNIDPEFKLTGYHYNICDIFNAHFFETGESDRKYDIGKTIYKLIYITEKNFLLGFIDNQAVLYLDNVILTKLRETSFSDFVKIVDRVISVYANANAIFFKLNTQSCENYIVDKVASKLISTINYDCTECTIIPPEHVDLFEDFSVISNLMHKLTSTIREQVKIMLEGTRWGINNQYSYKQLLDDLLTTKYQSDTNSKEKAFMQGLLYGSKFELAGWEISERRFSDNDCVCWEKNVEIIPCRLFYERKMYNINPSDDTWQNPFKITKLFVTSSGVMYCEGKHPNVSGGKVCMGDISGKINMGDVKKLQANLARCESLLTSINYDSPYDHSKREEMLAHSVCVEDTATVSDDSEYTAQGTIIQDIVFEDDDPDSRDVEDDSDLHTEGEATEEVREIVIPQNDENVPQSNG